jgi:hypothetical protein
VVTGKEPRSANEDLGDSAGTWTATSRVYFFSSPLGAFARVGVWKTDPPSSRGERTGPASFFGRPAPVHFPRGLQRYAATGRMGGSACVARQPTTPPRLRARYQFRGCLAAFSHPSPKLPGEGALNPIRPRSKSRTHTRVARRARRVSSASPRSGTSCSGRRRRGTERVAGFCEPAV